MIYEKYEIVSNDNPHLYTPASDHWGPSLEDLLVFSEKAPMKVLSLDDIKQHPLGCSMVGTRYGLPFPDHHAVLSYAGITDCEELQGTRCAVIGGVLVYPAVRKTGLGSLTVNWLVQTASTQPFRTKLKHEGFMSKCNADSVRLFKRLGFIAVGEESTKTLMFKNIKNVIPK